MRGSQHREHVLLVSDVGLRALGCVYVHQKALKFFFNTFFPSVRFTYVLEAHDRGSLFKDLVNRLFTSFVSMWSDIPGYGFRVGVYFYRAQDL